METTCNSNKEGGRNSVEEIKYWGMINSLLYITTSRPKIMFVVCLCAYLQTSLKESHAIEVKHIMRCLIGIHYMGLWYPKETTYVLVRYSDFDFVGCNLNQKSTNGTYHLLGNFIVS